MSEPIKAGKFLPKAQAGALPARGGLLNLCLEPSATTLVDVPPRPIVTLPPKAAWAKKRRGAGSEAKAAAAKAREAALVAKLGELGYREYRRVLGFGAKISVEWLRKKLDGGCEASGQPFGAGPWTPVIHRKDSEKRWVEANCEVVCAMYALARGAGTHAQFLQLVYAMAHREGLE
jgi:hypothetical protein